MPDEAIENKIPSQTMWRVWILLTLIAPVLLLAITAIAVFSIVASAGGETSVIPRELGNWFPYIVMVNHTLLFGIAAQLARSDGLSLGQLGWKQTDHMWIVEVAIGVFAGLVIYLIQSQVSEPIVAAIRGNLEIGSLRPESTPVLSLNWASLIAGTIFAGVAEETVYRGYIQRRLTARFGTVFGILVATLGFAVGLHWGLGPWSLIVVFVNGLLLAILFELRKNLLPCALAHAVVNALVVIL